MTCQLLNGGQGDSCLDKTGAEGVPERVPDHPEQFGLLNGRNEYLLLEGVSILGFRWVHRGREDPGGEEHLTTLQFFQDRDCLPVQRNVPGLSGLGQRDGENP